MTAPGTVETQRKNDFVKERCTLGIRRNGAPITGPGVRVTRTPWPAPVLGHPATRPNTSPLPSKSSLATARGASNHSIDRTRTITTTRRIRGASCAAHVTRPSGTSRKTLTAHVACSSTG